MIQGMYIAIFALVNITMVGLECGCYVFMLTMMLKSFPNLLAYQI